MSTLTAVEAAERLGVKPATLYTYVSRGWLTSLPGADRRARRYLADEVEGLRRRAEAGRGHGAAAAGAIGWGQPVVDTAISDISSDGPRLRGALLEDAVGWGFEACADHLWGAPCRPGARWARQQLPPRVFEEPGRGDDHHGALMGLLASLRQGDPLREGLPADLELDLARRLIRSLAVARARYPKAARAAASAPAIADALAVVFDAPAAAESIDLALVTCAEHELNASTFAVRVAASTGADLYACLIAGLAAHSGPLHGGASAQVAAMVSEAERRDDPEAVLARWAGRLPGCGHRLYPEGDPRFPLLVDAARAAPHAETELATSMALVESIITQGLPAPNLDFGLVLLEQAWSLPPQSGQLIFLVGRCAGWVAHAMEERERGAIIRPRARYVGD